MDLHEDFPTLMKGYQITAKRKRLRTLKEIAAYNVAKCISSNSDVQILHIPLSLYKLVSIFLDTYSGVYMCKYNYKTDDMFLFFKKELYLISMMFKYWRWP